MDNKKTDLYYVENSNNHLCVVKCWSTGERGKSIF
jgi:hypothetical protein